MNILSTMLSMLTSAYNRTDVYNADKGLPMRTNIGCLFSVVSWGFSLVAENAERVRLWSDIDNAAGATLDRHGANFGVDRGGADDLFYRLLIKVKILSQLSGGDIDTILSAVSTLYGIDAALIELKEIFPAKIQISIADKELPAGYAQVKDLVGVLVKRLLVAGVGLDMVYFTQEYVRNESYIGGRPTAEYTRVRVAAYSAKISDTAGIAKIGGIVLAELSRVRVNPNITKEGPIYA